MHVISSYRGNRPTNTQTNKHTQSQTNRQDRLQYTAPLASAQRKNRQEQMQKQSYSNLEVVLEIRPQVWLHLLEPTASHLQVLVVSDLLLHSQDPVWKMLQFYHLHNTTLIYCPSTNTQGTQQWYYYYIIEIVHLTN